MSGRFITFEGGEGCGKSTQVQALRRRLEARGEKVLLTREPGGTALCETVRALLREPREDPPVARSELLLFLAARAQLVETRVLPALRDGCWVLCDRFLDSTLAYQGYGRGLDVRQVAELNDFATGGLRPDLTILLDLSPAVAAARLRAREAQTGTAADRFETAGDAFHRRLRDGFLRLAEAEPGRIRVLDADRSREELEEEIWTLCWKS